MTEHQIADAMERGTKFHESLIDLPPAARAAAISWAAGMFIMEYHLSTTPEDDVMHHVRNFQTSVYDATLAVAEKLQRDIQEHKRARSN